jgi:hypothetical protein
MCFVFLRENGSSLLAAAKCLGIHEQIGTGANVIHPIPIRKH